MVRMTTTKEEIICKTYSGLRKTRVEYLKNTYLKQEQRKEIHTLKQVNCFNTDTVQTTVSSMCQPNLPITAMTKESFNNMTNYEISLKS